MNRKDFEDLLLSTGRKGVEELVEYIGSTDFYTAPASTKYHGAYAGGLFDHSCEVYELLKAKKDCPGIWHDALASVKDDSVILVSLLHDMCKANFYRLETSYKKIEGEWTTFNKYVVDDHCPYGHGEKSVMLIEEYIRLTLEEKMAIRWHMGPYSGQQDWGNLGSAMYKWPLCLALFESDMESTYVATNYVKKWDDGQ